MAAVERDLRAVSRYSPLPARFRRTRA